MGERYVYACDVGSTRRERFAWVRLDPTNPEQSLVGSTNIEALTESLEADFRAGVPIALGFESPLFIPVPASASDLSRGRTGEGGRSFAAPVGLAVAMLGLHQLTWVLSRIRAAGDNHRLTLDTADWAKSGDTILFLWEAFVSEAAHSADHITDAATAALEFVRHQRDVLRASTVTAERPLSLAGAAALWTGWRTDIGVLHEPTLVIKPTVAARATIRAVTGGQVPE